LTCLRVGGPDDLNVPQIFLETSVGAMEKNNYRLELPLKMAVCGGPLLPRREPTERRKVTGTSKRRRRKK
jgi:hypothetical protein